MDGAVAGWMSRAGGFNPVQGTGANQPVRAATSFNTLYPGVTFDGTNDELTLASTTGLPTGTTAGEVWALASFVTNATQGTVIDYGGTGTTARRGIADTTTETVRIRGGSASILETTAVVGTNIVGGFFESTEINGRVDGVAYGPQAVSISTGTTRLRIGADTANTAANFHAGVIAEIIITTGLLSAANRERIEGYWAWRFGLTGNLPENHTYKTARPTL